MGDDLIPVKSSGYARYEEVLLKRDAYKQEAHQRLVQYIKVFGELISNVFAAKIETIRIKKAMTVCQMAINRGEHIDYAEMQKQLSEYMKSYYETLDGMLKDNETAKKSKAITEYNLLKIKKLYRKLARMIHPDLNPRTAEDPELSELWHRLVVAYECNQLKDMEEIEVLITAACSGDEIPEIENIDSRIAEVEHEIETIKTTDPYAYGALLNDEEAVEEKKKALREELEEYRKYADILRQKLNSMLIMTGVELEWQEN